MAFAIAANEFTFRCRYCGSEFDGPKSLNEHRSRHWVSVETSPGSPAIRDTITVD